MDERKAKDKDIMPLLKKSDSEIQEILSQYDHLELKVTLSSSIEFLKRIFRLCKFFRQVTLCEVPTYLGPREGILKALNEYPPKVNTSWEYSRETFIRNFYL